MGISAAFMVPHPPLIVAEVGRGEERKIQRTIDAYGEVARRIGALRPETIVVISPHQTMYADYFHISPGTWGKGDFGQFRAGQVRMEVPYDTIFVKELCQLADSCGLPAGTEGERDRRLDHGTMVPLYFVNQQWEGYRLVRIGLSGLPLKMHYDLGRCIFNAAEALGRQTVLIASGDLICNWLNAPAIMTKERWPHSPAWLQKSSGKSSSSANAALPIISITCWSYFGPSFR